MSEGPHLRDMPSQLTEAALQRIASKRRAFEEMGFSETDAFDMAIAGVGIQNVLRLLKQDCPLDLVPKILV